MTVPELIDDNEFKRRLELLPNDWTSRTMRPASVLAALMQAAPDEPLQASVEEMQPLADAVAYATECINDEDTYIINCIASEQITYDELAARLGVSRSHSWRLYQRALHRLRTLLLNHPPVRERLGMEPTWNAAAMEQLVFLAGYEDEGDDVPYPLDVCADDISHNVQNAIWQMQDGKENRAVGSLSHAAIAAVRYLKTVDKWSLLDMHTLLCSKQNDYGCRNILAFGVTGVVVRSSDKAARLANLVGGAALAPRNESLLDTLFDIVGYAVIGRMLKAETFELPLDVSIFEAGAA